MTMISIHPQYSISTGAFGEDALDFIKVRSCQTISQNQKRPTRLFETMSTNQCVYSQNFNTASNLGGCIH